MKKNLLFLLCFVSFLVLLQGCSQPKRQLIDPNTFENFTDGAYLCDNFVQTVYGFSYLTDGYADENYTVKESLSIDFSLTGKFNQYTLTYFASAPIKAELVYRSVWGIKRTETIYLEAENSTFRSLINGFLKKKYGAKIMGMTVYPLLSDTRFVLLNMETSLLDVPSKTITIEGERYILGITLAQGGGMSRLVDKKGSSLCDNLLNRYDTGRLVQQSYYGTPGNEEYSAGFFNGSDWNYNPVQGGDMYNNESKIIDYRVGEDYIYIKCQPLDWSNDGFYTPSYMENTYKISGDKIIVSCRFIDFSGWEHPSRHQELPAFYTVSALDTFTYYGGENPWTADDLTVCENLPFWGDPAYAESCRFYVGEESWCAWTGSDGYGVGLYTSGVDLLYAGRCGDGHSADDNDVSCSYVAPLATVCLQFNQPLEYSYVIACGTTEEIRNTFTACHEDYLNDF